MMRAYTGFAGEYDRFMNNVPYDEWENMLAELFAEAEIRAGLMLELGCGTGTMTERMAARGYDMIGVDLSEDMLAEAMEKRLESGSNILYLNQDMREFELYGTVAGVYCICDSLNYLTEPADLAKTFALVNNYLDPGGIFVFDFNTPAEYRSPLRRAPIVETDDGVTMIWENRYEEDSRINEHTVTFFIPAETDGEETLYEKVEEIHVQRAYTVREAAEAVKTAGLKLLAVYASGTRQPPDEATGRVVMVAQESGKEIS